MQTTTDRPPITAERAKVLASLHAYIALEIVAILADETRLEIQSHALLKLLTERATPTALTCGEWPANVLHLGLALRGAKPMLRALGVSVKSIKRRTASGRSFNVWRFRRAVAEVAESSEPAPDGMGRIVHDGDFTARVI